MPSGLRSVIALRARTPPARGHPLADRVADDPTREGVFDRADVELALVGSCSVMSVNHSSFMRVALKSRRTRSSWTGGPGFLPDGDFFTKLDQIRCSEHSRHTRRSLTSWPLALELVGDEAVAEGRVVGVGVQGGVGEMGVLVVAVEHGLLRHL